MLALSSALVCGANAGDHHMHNQSGAYIGIQAGGTYDKNNLTAFYENSTFAVPAALVPYDEVRKSVNKFRAAGGVHVGYESCLTNGWLAAFEVSGMIYSNPGTKSIRVNLGETVISKLNRKYSVMPKINIGKQLNHCYNLYLILGLNYTKYKARVSEETNNISAQRNFNLAQFSPGLRIKFAPAGQRVSINLESYYSLKAKKTIKTMDSNALVVGNRNKFSSITGLIGLSYKI